MNNKIHSKFFLMLSLFLIFSIFFLSPGYSEVKNIRTGPPIKIKIVDAKYINNDILITLKNVSTEDLDFYITYATLGLALRKDWQNDLPTIYYKKDPLRDTGGKQISVSDPNGIPVRIKNKQIFKTRLYLHSVLDELPKGHYTLVSNLFFDIDKEAICHHFRCEFEKK